MTPDTLSLIRKFRKVKVGFSLYFTLALRWAGVLGPDQLYFVSPGPGWLALGRPQKPKR